MGGRDFITLYIPKRIADEIRRRGLDIELFIIDSLSEKLKLDPQEEAAIYVELAERFLDDARRYIDQNDPVQASEKLYKVAEECIKALAIKFRTPESEEARREGRWWIKLLSRAAKKLSSQLSEPIISYGWSVGYDLHVWGFHEAALDIDAVKTTLNIIEQMLVKTREIIKK
ncbi:MAG: PaREP1 family protein [Sulfolobales archaeon]